MRLYGSKRLTSPVSSVPTGRSQSGWYGWNLMSLSGSNGNYKKKCGAPYIRGGARRTARPPKLMGAHGYRLQHGGGERCVALIEEVTEMCRWMIKKVYWGIVEIYLFWLCMEQGAFRCIIAFHLPVLMSISEFRIGKKVMEMATLKRNLRSCRKSFYCRLSWFLAFWKMKKLEVELRDWNIRMGASW